MYPEDRVLVGVINRQRDFRAARDEHWYRVPCGRFRRTLDVEYIAFFQSRAFRGANGAIHWYARVTGLELVRRVDVIPDEPDHPHAHDLYFRVALARLERKTPPIRNRSHRPISFILTTGDRFLEARSIADLYDRSGQFVDRVFHALR
jgi:hypothetical protein